MELLIGLFVVTYWACAAPAAIADAVATWRASKAGEFDFIDKQRDRRASRQERWGKAWQATRAARHRKAGGDGNYRAGAGAYFGDVYHGFWERGLEKRKAKADARGPYVYDPDAPTLGQRVTAAVGDKVQRLRETRLPESVRRAGHLLVDPVGEKRPEGRRSYLDDVEPERGRDRYRAPDDDLFALADQLDEPQRPDIRHEDTTTGNPPTNEGDTTVSAEAAVVAGSAAAAVSNANSNGGTTAMNSATGDVHDVETCKNECVQLADDLVRIDTSLDVIDEAIRSARDASERIEAWLSSKNAGDARIGGLRTAMDMLNADKIKELMDAVAAAKQGVQDTIDELSPLEEASELVAGADGSILNGR